MLFVFSTSEIPFWQNHFLTVFTNVELVFFLRCSCQIRDPESFPPTHFFFYSRRHDFLRVSAFPLFFSHFFIFPSRIKLTARRFLFEPRLSSSFLLSGCNSSGPPKFHREKHCTGRSIQTLIAHVPLPLLLTPETVLESLISRSPPSARQKTRLHPQLSRSAASSLFFPGVRRPCVPRYPPLTI